jgi:hypothetical protein
MFISSGAVRIVFKAEGAGRGAGNRFTRVKQSGDFLTKLLLSHLRPYLATMLRVFTTYDLLSNFLRYSVVVKILCHKPEGRRFETR